MRCNFNGTLLSSVMPPVLLTEFLFGVLGNGLALWIFCFHMRPWKSSTVLLFNLAMADFLLNMAFPFRAIYYISDMKWKFGHTLCNICLFMLAMNRCGSTLFLMAIAVDRYMRVVHPHHPINSLSISKAICGALAIWLLTISLTVHVFNLDHINTTHCESFVVDTEMHHHLNWHTFAFLFSFYVPLLVVLYCTFNVVAHLKRSQLGQQAKIKKALWFIIVVAVLFVVCYLPSNIAQLMIWIQSRQARKLPDTEACSALEDLTIVFFITISLTYLNSVLDPVVYYFSSPTFKNICRKVLRLSQTDSGASTEKKTRETGSQSLNQL